MLRYSEKRNNIIALLLTDPELSRLHFAALDRVEARLADLRGTEAYLALTADLARASTVPITEIVARPPQARDKEKIAALMSDVEKLRAARAKAGRRAAGPTAPVAVVPLASYLDTPQFEKRELPWVASHGILLPLDERMFPHSILPVMQAGKFERGLARRMPQVLPKGASVLEIGGAVGFLALHLFRTRPDLTSTLTEGSPAFTAMFRLIIDRNGMSLTDRLQHRPQDPAAPLAALAAISSLRPKVLLVSDPRLTPETLTDLLPRLPTLPEQVFLFGRFLQAHHAALSPLTALLQDIGYAPGYGFDPNVCRGFGLGLLPEPATTGQAPALAALSAKKKQRGF